MTITPQTVLRFVAGAAITAAVLFLVWYFSSIVVYILVSAVLAVMGNPLVKLLSGIRIRGWRVPRWLAAFTTLVVIWVVLAVLCTLRTAQGQVDEPLPEARHSGNRSGCCGDHADV